MNELRQPFSSNIHSKYEIEWKAVPAEAAENLRRVLKTFYNIQDVISIEQVDEWEHMSNNFKVAYQDPTGTRYILLRKHIQLRDEASLSLLTKIITSLAGNEVSVPAILPTKNGLQFQQEGENFYQAFTFVSGNHFSGAPHELSAVAQAIGHMHRKLKSLSFQEQIEKKPLLVPPWNIDGWHFFFSSANRCVSQIDITVKRHKSMLESACDQVLKSRTQSDELEKQPIHADLHPHNVIIREDESVVILDFEGVRNDVVWRDVANACHRFVRQYVVFQNISYAKTLLHGLEIFIDSYAVVDPQIKEHTGLFAAFIKDELLRKLFKDLSLYYIDHNMRNLEGGALETKLSLLREADIIQNAIT